MGVGCSLLYRMGRVQYTTASHTQKHHQNTSQSKWAAVALPSSGFALSFHVQVSGTSS